MKSLKKFLLWFFGILMVLVAALYLTGYGYLLTAVRTIYFHGHVTAFLDDYQYFDNRTVAKGEPQPWAEAKDYNKVAQTHALDSINRKTGTVAFLIIKNDSIWHEAYYDGYDKDSRSNSFSMAKSVVSAALGKAITEGKIKSLDQKVSDFFPEFKDGKSANMTVGDLSSMASGLNWDESYYSPFSITTRAYFDDDLNSVILGLKGTTDPGKSYLYLSGNTQLLAMCIEKATGKSLADYVSDSFWKPMGAENEALWQTDHKDGMVKAYCCIASNARDFARFGRLYKQYGKWNGKQLIDSAFVAKSIKPRFDESPQYGYGWWLFDHDGKKGYCMRGHLGQYVIVLPDQDVLIVRLGKSTIKTTTDSPFGDDFYVYLEEATKMLSNKK
ncbi:serine hydrolase [Flavobacterium magnum]|uniref:Serine hydrolase n=1 Tax=Flavobacterium magnum TaxID=2162713 RepID=A0A2S0RCC0_9FLAO|nr:serine hydrolase [Flavobacterium magnum]AWA29189.1 serine hydrolase [Flavobacterium magnum]